MVSKTLPQVFKITIILLFKHFKTVSNRFKSVHKSKFRSQRLSWSNLIPMLLSQIFTTYKLFLQQIQDIDTKPFLSLKHTKHTRAFKSQNHSLNLCPTDDNQRLLPCLLQTILLLSMEMTKSLKAWLRALAIFLLF